MYIKPQIFKNKTLITLLSVIMLIQNIHADNINSNIIINLTGKLIELHFHSKVSSHFDLYNFVRPLMIGGSPLTDWQGLTASLLPQPVNMHKTSCHSVTASIMIKKNKKDKSIKSCKIKIPSFTTLNDYKLTIENDVNETPTLKFTKCDSIRLIPLHKGADKKSISRTHSNKHTSNKSAPTTTNTDKTIQPIVQAKVPVITTKKTNDDNSGSES